MNATEKVRAVLEGTGLQFEEPAHGTFVVSLPGERKLVTTCAIVVGQHSVTFNAFVIRAPEENHESVYRWVLEKNARMYGVFFAIDSHGDIYLVGRMPLHAVNESEIDRYLGAVLQYSDSSFDPLLEMGFAGAIKREWAWRVSRGESLANLEAFEHLIDE